MVIIASLSVWFDSKCVDLSKQEAYFLSWITATSKLEQEAQSVSGGTLGYPKPLVDSFNLIAAVQHILL
ncbi:unnamed protein product [Trifolium pratense]|uniref:Uncharacterized protein n=1 Tax=Trifolium pratense TaxID=57577 RepID=A0ACB0JBP8_TRIPR|nr:unnamed protein product [Trifolium pratense]